MSKEFHPITDKHSNELAPTRHNTPLIERYATAVLRCLAGVSQPTIESETKTAHVSCHETGACIILTVPSPKGSGDKRVKLEVQRPNACGQVEQAECYFDSFEQFERTKKASSLALEFMRGCLAAPPRDRMAEMVGAATQGVLFT